MLAPVDLVGVYDNVARLVLAEDLLELHHLKGRT